MKSIAKWDCRDGTPEEDHDWVYVSGLNHMECRQCKKNREASEQEREDALNEIYDAEYDEWRFNEGKDS